MNLVTFNPEKHLDSFFDIDTFFGLPRSNVEDSSVLPKVNIVEKKEAFYLDAETPGMTQKDVSVLFQDGILTLKGKQEQNSHSDMSNYHIREFSKQSFTRSFKLSDQIDSGQVIARMDQGILKVTLPKKEQAKPKRIEIKVDS
jgi:HSP20 family protein